MQSTWTEGIRRLQEKIPALRDPIHWVALAGSFAVISSSVFGLLIVVDRQTPIFSGIAQIGVLAGGLASVASMFILRDQHNTRWGDAAFPQAFIWFALPGLSAVAAAIGHNAILPGEKIFPAQLDWLVRCTAAYLIVSGILLWGRAVLALGLDNLVLLYVYYPFESRQINSSAYAFLRHPVYSAAISVALGLGIICGTWMSLAFGGLLIPILLYWINQVEEPELIARFGPTYSEYRRTTPPFFPRVRDWLRYLRFLVLG